MSNLNVHNISPIGNKLSVSGSLHVRDDITLGGSINLGDANTDTITVTGEFTSSLIPDLNETFDLGSTAKGSQYIADKALYDNAGSSVTLPSGVPFACINNGEGAAVGKMLGYTGYTNELFANILSLANVSGSARTLHASLIPETGAMVAMTDAQFKAVAVFGSLAFNS